jgi:hypothetical protein
VFWNFFGGIMGVIYYEERVEERRHLNTEAVLLLQGLRRLAMAYGVVRGSRTAMLTQVSSLYPTNPYQITTYRHGEPKAPMR